MRREPGREMEGKQKGFQNEKKNLRLNVNFLLSEDIMT